MIKHLACAMLAVLLAACSGEPEPDDLFGSIYRAEMRSGEGLPASAPPMRESPPGGDWAIYRDLNNSASLAQLFADIAYGTTTWTFTDMNELVGIAEAPARNWSMRVAISVDLTMAPGTYIIDVSYDTPPEYSTFYLDRASLVPLIADAPWTPRRAEDGTEFRIEPDEAETGENEKRLIVPVTPELTAALIDAAAIELWFESFPITMTPMVTLTKNGAGADVFAEAIAAWGVAVP